MAICCTNSPISTTSSRDGSARRQSPVPDPNWSGDRPAPSTGLAPYRIYNIGNQIPARLLRVIEILETCLGRRACVQFQPMQPGDVPATHADVDDLARDIGFRPVSRSMPE